jgi:hypothetical protein
VKKALEEIEKRVGLPNGAITPNGRRSGQGEQDHFRGQRAE